ncbi:MAG: SpoIIE family protein phosphatase, partial [Bacteroidia bacterium]|nr:SpoIIE family protein phosphatase [Bacteroidia bacterium]
LESYTSSLEIANELNDKEGIALANLNIGGLYVELHNFKKATIFLHKSLSLTKEIGAKDRIIRVYRALSDVYSKLYQYQEAYNYHQLYSALKDSIFNEQSAKSMNEMQAKYESEKKEKEIQMLTKDNELQVLQAQQQEDQIKKQWFLILGIVFILGLLISLIYVVHSQLKFKKEANTELEQTNDQLEHINVELGKKNKSIAESINYAQRIQETIMPTQKHLQEVFPESFIFYKAKDVVSGDFPWVLSNENNFFAAAIDCTGHGVPGAMMSMIGYFLMNDIVGGRKIHDPAIILDYLHEGIIQTLRQEENLESKDGMDIALCAINKEKREVHYAGAHRSLLYLHNGEIEEIRGNRFPVGGLQYSNRGKEIKFKSHKLQLEKGDSIYFYSDGLIDQIGGPKGRRFQNNQVKEIILENIDKPMVELNSIINERFKKWMGSENQLDDVIMMGIKV